MRIPGIWRWRTTWRADPRRARAARRLHAALPPVPRLLSGARARALSRRAPPERSHRMKPWSFYQQRLDLVSRSFALCIPQLDSPFRDRVALAYLLFRVLDTIEDAPFTDRAIQQQQFERLRAFLHTMPT